MTYLFLVFIASLFLKLGADTLERPILQIVYFGLLGAGFLSVWLKGQFRASFRSLTPLVFLLFFGFEIVRLLWAMWQIGVRGLEDSITLPLHRYLSSPVTWLLSLGFFTLSLTLFRTRSETGRLLWTLAWCGFILALVALPPLITTRGLGYETFDGRVTFFPAIVYFHRLVEKYLVSRFAHSNYIGDVVALGFFPALGLFFYSLQQYKEKPSFTTVALAGLFVATQALAIILFFSRATIICFALAFLVFLLATLIKYPSRIQFTFAGIAVVLVMVFLLWAGNIQATWKEVQTAKLEVETTQSESSFSTNREGAKRALGIYQTFTLWGVGKKGFSSVSNLYATPGMKHFFITKYVAMCHYLQVLAEEGSGAFLYFLFLLTYFAESVIRLFKTKSRFQFMAGLSLCMPVLMILANASVKPVMEFFAVSTPVYIFMGATLGVLSSNFEHSDLSQGVKTSLAR